MHLAQVGPPQSTSVSMPSLVPLPQGPVPMHLPLLQTPLRQSLLPPHLALAPQRGQGVAPPQSTSLSPPFCFASVQVGATQTSIAQIPLWQSPATLQAWPFTQALPCDEQTPPQSTSVSVPFFLVS